VKLSMYSTFDGFKKLNEKRSTQLKPKLASLYSYYIFDHPTFLDVKKIEEKMVRHKHKRIKKQEIEQEDLERVLPDKTIKVDRRGEISNRGTAESRSVPATGNEAEASEFESPKI